MLCIIIVILVITINVNVINIISIAVIITALIVRGVSFQAQSKLFLFISQENRGLGQINDANTTLLKVIFFHLFIIIIHIITILQQFAERRVLLKQVLGAQHDYGNTHFRFPGSNLDPPPLPPGMMLR